MMRVDVKPALLRWARERSRKGLDDLTVRFPKLPEWERGDSQPTLKQLEAFAKATYTPVGYLFLPEPPSESVPIPDFRTVGNARFTHPSADLLDTIYLCQQRQEWYRDFALATGQEPLPFVGSVRVTSDVEATAANIRHALGFDVEQRRQIPTWTDALRHFIEQADSLGILVMRSGVVLNNNHRRLDPAEFRGFAMADELAPLVFINGADTKAAQMFTLAHELVHIWLGQSAVSDAQAAWAPDNEVERWCNQVAAELLVPLSVLGSQHDLGSDVRDEANRLAQHFKVSKLVIFRRLYDGARLKREQFRAAYDDEVTRLRAIPTGNGGNFYLTQAARLGKRFASALVVSTLEGQTLYRDTFRLLGISKLATFRELRESLGVVA